MLLKYVSDDPKQDRDLLLRGQKLERIGVPDIWKLPFRNLFIDEKDLKIADAINGFFEAVRSRWPTAWADKKREGLMLNRTNGFRALMRLYGYLHLEHGTPGGVVPKDYIANYFEKVPLKDSDFNKDNFVPGSSGEARLFRVLKLEEEL